MAIADGTLEKSVKDKTVPELITDLTWTLCVDPHRFAYGRSWDRMQLFRLGMAVLPEIEAWITAHPPCVSVDEIGHIQTHYRSLIASIKNGEQPPVGLNTRPMRSRIFENYFGYP